MASSDVWQSGLLEMDFVVLWKSHNGLLSVMWNNQNLISRVKNHLPPNFTKKCICV